MDGHHELQNVTDLSPFDAVPKKEIVPEKVIKFSLKDEENPTKDNGYRKSRNKEANGINDFDGDFHKDNAFIINEMNRLRDEMETLRAEIDYIKSSRKPEIKQDFTAKSFKFVLGPDTFSLMMIRNPLSTSWLLGVISFMVQVIISALVLKTQVDEPKLGIPFKVKNEVRVGQFFAILIYLLNQQDILTPFKYGQVLHYESDWHRKLQTRKRDKTIFLWTCRVFIPCFLLFAQGVLVTITSFILIAQTDDLVELLKDFSALMIISQVDNRFFDLASFGYLGETLYHQTLKIKDGIVLEDLNQEDLQGILDPNQSIYKSKSQHGTSIGFMDSFDRKTGNRTNIVKVQVMMTFRYIKAHVSMRSLYFFFVCNLLTWTWIHSVVLKQLDGTFFKITYPECRISPEEIKKVGDSKCDGGFLNTNKCGLDGGDCTEFNIVFPNCKLPNVHHVGDGTCQSEFNIPECSFDDGDCCPFEYSDERFGDGKCHGGFIGSGYCNYDLNDCNDFRRQFSECDLEQIALDMDADNVKTIPILGNGICESKYYLNEECGHEFGDCQSCVVNDYSRIGDGVCDGASYNTPDCLFDGGDCKVEGYDNCHVDVPEYVGDGICNGGDYASDDCGNDGNDCDLCQAIDFALIGNGVCNEFYNHKNCSWDGWDCDIAPGKLATQSSTYQPYAANYSLSTQKNQIGSKTLTEIDPWWKVDMYGVSYAIERVVIHSGLDGPKNLDSFQLDIFYSGSSVFQYRHRGEIISNRTIVDTISSNNCTSIIGDAVKISLRGLRSLSLQRVAIFGKSISTNKSNSPTPTLTPFSI